MVRHGESEWNKQNLFCGWCDVPLTSKGESEARAAAKAIRDAGLKFDIAYTSVLSRAFRSAEIILDAINQTDIPLCKTWRLNERHYGSLTGLNRVETAAKYGEEQVQTWRRSYDVAPPPMTPDNKYYDGIVNDPRYAEGIRKSEFPMHESLKMTIARTLPYWNDVIVPQIRAGKRILIVAHGNSLRGVVMHLDNMSAEEIRKLNLPTGIPFVYELDENLKPVVSLKFLEDEEKVRKAMEAIASQIKAKK